MMKDWTVGRWVAFLPLLAVIFLYFVEGATRSAYFACNNGKWCESIPANIWNVISENSQVVSPASTPTDGKASATVSPDLLDRKMRGLRYSGRMAWFSLAEVYVLTCIVAFAVTAIQVYQQSSRRRLIWVVGVLLISALVGVIFYQIPQAHMAVFLILLNNPVTHQPTIPEVPGIREATNFLNSLGNAAMFGLLLAICAVLLPAPLEPYPGGLKQISRKMKSLRAVLYAGTILLVATMLLKNALFQWVLVYTSQEGTAVGTAKGLVTSLLSIDGTFYTLILAAAYLPAWFILQRRARLLPDLPEEEPEVEKKFQEYGITFTFAKAIPRILAIFAPVLASPLGEIVNGILF